MPVAASAAAAAAAAASVGGGGAPPAQALDAAQQHLGLGGQRWMVRRKGLLFPGVGLYQGRYTWR